MAEVRDPIHGFIHYNELERAVLDSPPVQRLKYVHQLALGYLVYPGATHSRFEHALGTMELAGRAFDAICQNSPDLSRQVFGGEADRGRWRATLRAAGLLHDVGHAPFSHAGDDLLGEGMTHEQMGADLILSSPLKDLLTRHGPFRLDPEEVAYVATGVGSPRSEAALVAKDIITADLGVDRMDYLRRDSYMCGVSYGAYDLPRLVDTLMLARVDGGPPTLALEAGGVNAAEGLLTARYFMFSQVYFHRVRDVYDGHLIRFLRASLPAGRYPSSPGKYLEWDDVKVLTLLRKTKANVDAAAIRGRQHYRAVADLTPTELRRNVELPRLLEERLSADFGEAVLVRNSSKSAVVLQEGDVLVVDPLSGRIEDILQRSTTLSALQGVWHFRVFSDTDHRTDVLDVVNEVLAAAESTADTEAEA